MKFKLNSTQARLYGLLQSVCGVIRRHGTFPILGNVLIQTHTDGRITAVGSDLEIEIIATQRVGDFTGSLSTTVECKKLLDILQTMSSDEEVSLELDDKDNLILRGANGKYKLACLDAADYPRLETAPNFDETFQITQKVLKGMIDRTSFAMAVADIRYYLIGTQLVVDGGNLSICATDGHRLAMDVVAVKSTIPSRREVIVPRKSVLELKRLMRSKDDIVDVQLALNQTRICFDEVEFVTKLVEGKFPDTQRILPKLKADKVTVSRSDLLLAVQRADIIMDQRIHGVRMVIERDLVSGQLKIESVNDKNESVDLTMRVDFHGPRVEIGFNSKYLLDALPTMEGDNIVLAFADTPDPGPALITLEHNSSFQYILMPLKL
jgi:DNA polymerase-3 subunit beta